MLNDVIDRDVDVDVDQLFSMYDTVLWNVPDQLAPQIAVRLKPNCSTPSVVPRGESVRRMLEHRYRRTRRAIDCRLGSIQNAAEARRRLVTCGRSSTKIWKTMSSLLGRNCGKIVMSSPIRSCSLDPVPTFILRQFMRLFCRVGCPTHCRLTARPTHCPHCPTHRNTQLSRRF